MASDFERISRKLVSHGRFHTVTMGFDGSKESFTNITSGEAIDEVLAAAGFPRDWNTANERRHPEELPPIIADRCDCGHLFRAHKEMGCQSCPPGQCKLRFG